MELGGGGVAGRVMAEAQRGFVGSEEVYLIPYTLCGYSCASAWLYIGMHSMY